MKNIFYPYLLFLAFLSYSCENGNGTGTESAGQTETESNTGAQSITGPTEKADNSGDASHVEGDTTSLKK